MATIKQTKQLQTVTRLSGTNVKVFALGGVGEVGKNMYCVEIGDELLIIDSGILFPDDDFGVDYIIPDYTYLKENEDKIVGLFITHGHEDHIGGIPYLLRKVAIPKLYASGLAVGLIKNKLKEHTNITIPITEFHKDSVFRLKHMEISFFQTNHSIPDSFGIAIKTKYGYVLHTGDFKFDFTPLANHTDYSKLTRYSDAGVLCLLSDSTNAYVSKFSTSERKIGDSIRSLFSTIKGRIIISTFASNVYRVQQIVEASVEAGRKVIVFGRSMEKTINVGTQLNYIKAPPGTFITAKQFPHISPGKVTILSTGSQGEPLAALSRIAEGTHRTIQIIPGDTIVFSSSAIPGNQEGINRTINKLYRAGANVIINSPLTDTHTSGHASETELKIMLSLTKPTYFVPIHGEYSMLKRHAQIATSTGVLAKNCFLLDNGDVLSMDDKEAVVKEAVRAGNIYIDANTIDVDPTIIRERKILSDDGVLSIIVSLDRNNQKKTSFSIVSRGFIYMKDSENLIQKIRNKADSVYTKYIQTNKRFIDHVFKTQLITELNTLIFELTERKPVIVPIILRS